MLCYRTFTNMLTIYKKQMLVMTGVLFAIIPLSVTILFSYETKCFAQPTLSNVQAPNKANQNLRSTATNDKIEEPIFQIKAPSDSNRNCETLVNQSFLVSPGKPKAIRLFLRGEDLRKIDYIGFHMNFDEDAFFKEDANNGNRVEARIIEPSGFTRSLIAENPDDIIPRDNLAACNWRIVFSVNAKVKKQVRINLAVYHIRKPAEIHLADSRTNLLRLGTVDVEATVNHMSPYNRVIISDSDRNFESGDLCSDQQLFPGENNKVKYSINTFALGQGFHSFLLALRPYGPIGREGAEFVDFYVGNNFILLLVFIVVTMLFAIKEHSLRQNLYVVLTISILTFLYIFGLMYLLPFDETCWATATIDLMMSTVLIIVSTVVFTFIGWRYLAFGKLRTFFWIPVCTPLAFVNFYQGILIIAIMIAMIVFKSPFGGIANLGKQSGSVSNIDAPSENSNT